MMETERLIKIAAAVSHYRQTDRDESKILRLMEGISGEEYSYLCRCFACDSSWYFDTKKLLTRKWPARIPEVDLEFLTQILGSPWPHGPWTNEISPASVVLHVAGDRGLLKGESLENLGTALLSYLEGFPEIAAEEFLCIEQGWPSVSAALWRDLSIANRDAVAFAARRRSSRHEFYKLIGSRKRVEQLAGAHLSQLRTQIEAVGAAVGRGHKGKDLAELLIENHGGDDAAAIAAILRLWIQTQAPPFILQDLANHEVTGAPTGSSGDAGNHGQLRDTCQQESSRPAGVIAAMGERYRHSEHFAPELHGREICDLSPLDTVQLLIEMLTKYPQWTGVLTCFTSQAPLFIRSFGREYVLQMLHCSWGELGAARLVYLLAVSGGLVTPAFRVDFSHAIGRFLSSHPESAADEFEQLRRECSVAFATGVWACLPLDLQRTMRAAIRQRLVSALEWYVSHPLDHFATAQLSQLAQQDDRPANERTSARAILDVCDSLAEAIGPTQANFLLEWLARLASESEEGPLAATESFRARVLALPSFCAEHRFSASFGLVQRLGPPMEKAAAWVSTVFGRAFRQKPVFIGASAPYGVQPGATFVARLYAYVEEFQGKVEDVLNSLAPTSKSISGLRQCRWRIGERVRVVASGEKVVCDDPVAEIEWNGAYVIVDFCFRVQSDASVEPQDNAVLVFRVDIASTTVATIRMEVCIRERCSERVVRTTTESARTGFASYATQDRGEVLGRVSSIEQSAGILVFVDCLDLHATQEWQPILEREIIDRDVFLLFWSKYASASRWVNWEWHTALQKKGTDRMEIHSLQSADQVPPPPELAHLNFGDRYLTAQRNV